MLKIVSYKIIYINNDCQQISSMKYIKKKKIPSFYSIFFLVLATKYFISKRLELDNIVFKENEVWENMLSLISGGTLQNFQKEGNCLDIFVNGSEEIFGGDDPLSISE